MNAPPFGGFSEAMEKDIEQALVSQLDSLGLQLFIDEDGRSGQQYPAGDHGRIDVLANDSKGDFVVIELKRDAPRATIGQVAGYIAFVRKHLAKPAGRSAFGWILARPASSVDDRLLEEAADAVGIQVKWYRVRVELLPDPPSIGLGPSVAA
jgi:RecB family endonuclease NucS